MESCDKESESESAGKVEERSGRSAGPARGVVPPRRLFFLTSPNKRHIPLPQPCGKSPPLLYTMRPAMTSL